MLRLVTFILATLSLCTPGWSYLTIQESGEPVPQNQLHLGFSPQFLLARESGSNGMLTLRTGLDEGRDFSFQLGGGYNNFWSTLSTRWIPIPDYNDQPAIGFRFDVTLAHLNGVSNGSFRLAPFVSKRLRTDVGHLEPYLYLPIGLNVQQGRYDNLSSFVLGSQVQIEDLRPIYLYGEAGFNLKNSVSYFTIGIFSTFDR